MEPKKSATEKSRALEPRELDPKSLDPGSYRQCFQAHEPGTLFPHYVGKDNRHCRLNASCIGLFFFISSYLNLTKTP